MAAVVSLSCNMITTHVWLHGSLCVKQFFGSLLASQVVGEQHGWRDVCMSRSGWK